jgi:hypothetical protein
LQDTGSPEYQVREAGTLSVDLEIKEVFLQQFSQQTPGCNCIRAKKLK